MSATIPAPVLPAAGQTVTLNVPGAWHRGLVGSVVDVAGETVTVRYIGHGTVTAPIGVVAPLPARYV